MQREFIFTNKWLDLVFENRNQSYGAFVLRKNLHRNILIGYFVAVIFMSSLVFTMYQFSAISIGHIKGFINELPKQIIYEIKPIFSVTPPETKTNTKSTQPKPNTGNLIPIVKDSVMEAEIKEKKDNMDILSNSKDTSALSDSGAENSFKETGSKETIGSTEVLSPYMVDKLPEYPGGDPSMFRFIIKNTHIPFEYLDAEISKTVYISFIIDSTGKVNEVNPEKNYDDYPKLAEEAKKTVAKMPRWNPGQQHGKNVAVRMVLPVKFSVKKDF